MDPFLLLSCVLKVHQIIKRIHTCQMFQYIELSASGVVTSEQVPPNSMTLGGLPCIMSKNSLVPTAISH